MTRVFVLGNAGFDLSLGMCRLPAAGETLVAESVARAPGGKGLNQAVVAARAGAQVVFAAPVGSDADGESLAAAIALEPFAFRRLTVDAATDLSVVMVTPEGENCIATVGLAADALSADEAASFAGQAGREDWLVLQGNLSLAATEAALRAGSARVILNTAPLRWPMAGLLPFCYLVIANAVEAESLTGLQTDAAAAQLIALGAHAAIVTLGGAGAILAEGNTFRRFSAPPALVLDSTGAGDTLCGMLVAALARHLPLPHALAIAQIAAADSVTRPGAFAALPTAAFLKGLWDRS